MPATATATSYWSTPRTPRRPSSPRGFGVARFDVMYNDFVIVGPPEDPAKLADLRDGPKALARIAAAEAIFASRGDDSGTHKAELALWQAADIDPSGASGRWYRETGQGMGATLNTAVGMSAYSLTDRGTWISFKNRGAHKVLVQGDRRLFNQYGVILVNPERHPRTKAADGQAFIDWLTGPEGQAAIRRLQAGRSAALLPETPRATARAERQ